MKAAAALLRKAIEGALMRQEMSRAVLAENERSSALMRQKIAEAEAEIAELRGALALLEVVDDSAKPTNSAAAFPRAAMKD